MYVYIHMYIYRHFYMYHMYECMYICNVWEQT
jgi:hypothetical protein